MGIKIIRTFPCRCLPKLKPLIYNRQSSVCVCHLGRILRCYELCLGVSKCLHSHSSPLTPTLWHAKRREKVDLLQVTWLWEGKKRWKAVPLRWKWDGRPELLRGSSCQGHCVRLEAWTLINWGLSADKITSTLFSNGWESERHTERDSSARWIMQESVWETEWAYRFCWCGKRLFRYLRQAFVPDTD